MRPLLIFLFALSLTGCSDFSIKDSLSSVRDYFTGGADNTDPPNELVELTPEVQIDEVWRESVGVGTDEQSLKLVPAIGNGKIYAADRDGLVQARSLSTGSLVWEAEIENEAEEEVHFSGGPGLGSATVVLGSDDGEVYALNSETGAVLWKSIVPSEVMAIPVVAKGTVIIRTTDGSVIALDEKTGQKTWSYEHTVPALTVRGTGAPLILGDTLIEGYDNGKLLALQLNDGKYLWESSITIPKGRSEVERLIDLDVDPIEAAGMIYTSSYNGGTAAVTASNGEGQWRNEEVSSNTGLSQDAEHLYVSNVNDHIVQIDKRTGSSLWEQKELHGRKLSAPTAYQNYIVVGDFDGYVHWLSESDGRQLGRIQIAGVGIEAKPLIDGDIVYIYAKDGTLAALRAH